MYNKWTPEAPDFESYIKDDDYVLHDFTPEYGFADLDNYPEELYERAYYSVRHINDGEGDPGIGSDIECEYTGQYGTVVGIIYSKLGVPACYKVRYYDYDENGEHAPDAVPGFDYIRSDLVTCVEEYSWDIPKSLARFGYEYVPFCDEYADEVGYYKDFKTGDVVYW